MTIERNEVGENMTLLDTSIPIVRELVFNVDKQILKVDPNCDFSNLVPGTQGYLRCRFTFSDEWNKYVRIAEFTSGNNEYQPQFIDINSSCIIPSDALSRPAFNIRVIGSYGPNKLITNKVTVVQNGGNK